MKERPAGIESSDPAQAPSCVVAKVGGDLTAEAGADDVNGGRVDREGGEVSISPKEYSPTILEQEFLMFQELVKLEEQTETISSHIRIPPA